MTTASIKKRSVTLPWMQASTSIGIDIGQFETKVVVLENRFRGQPEIGAAKFATNIRSEGQDDTKETQVRSLDKLGSKQVEELTSRIKSLVQSQAINSRTPEVNVTLSMSACDFRRMQLNEGKLDQTSALQKIAEVTGDTRSRRLAVLPLPEDMRHNQIPCLSLPEDLSWNFAKSLDAAGLTPQSINGMPWCLTNAIALAEQDAQQPSELSLAVDWSYGPPLLIAVRSGSLLYARKLAGGGVGSIVQRVQSRMQLSPAAAVRWLEHCTNSAQLGELACESRMWKQNCVRELAAEIIRAAQFVEWKLSGKKVEKVWLLGGGAELCDLATLLSELLPFSSSTWRLKTSDEQLTAEFAVAASLARQGG